MGGDNWTEVGGGARASKRGSRHNSGEVGSIRPYQGRHSQGEESWTCGSYQDRASYSGRSSTDTGGLGRQNPAGPRKRASSTSEQPSRVAVRSQRSRQTSGSDAALKPEQ